MNASIVGIGLIFLILPFCAVQAHALPNNRIRTANGIVEGTVDTSTGIAAFKGIPYAQSPVGDLRWKPPQAVKDWSGIREAAQFGPRAMQLPLYGDMVFRSNGMSEDCLYLNVWTPAQSDRDRLPVLVYFFGGGFQAGDGSENRYDGASMAQKGIVAVTVNYRLGLFGFFAHPELTNESPHHASGNYGLMDQAAALQWVRRNIAAFGGDPDRVTIAGESAGSMSVSGLMASPLSKNLIAGAIGESGSFMGAFPLSPLADAEKNGLKFAASVGAKSLAALRAMPADQLIQATAPKGSPHFSPIIDGYFFPQPPEQIYAAGEQAHVPLLVGWNSEENSPQGVLGNDPPTVANFVKAIQKLYGDNAGDALLAYGVTSDDQVTEAATHLASARFIAYSTWKWCDLQCQTGGKPVYRYYFSRARPPLTPDPSNPGPTGAVHSAEIEYALGNLATNTVYGWTADDYKISSLMESYFANFVKTGDPNGPGLPPWPAANTGGPVQVMHLDVDSGPEPEQGRGRYLFLDDLYTQVHPH